MSFFAKSHGYKIEMVYNRCFVPCYNRAGRCVRENKTAGTATWLQIG
jgi:hypothetical protein